MTKSQIHIQMSPYRRIAAAGFDIKIKKHTAVHRVQLVKGEDVVAFADCPRTSNLSSDEILHKARRGAWGPTSTIYKALEAFAAVAESNTAL